MKKDEKYMDTNWLDGDYLNATFCVTEDCNLRCSYCYMVGKNTFKKMSFDVARKCMEFLLSDAYTIGLSDNLMMDFIGGEPLLEMELIDKISDYAILKMYAEKHKWFDNFKFVFSTNGTLYGQPLIREYAEKYRNHCTFGLSIDGTKEQHDSARVKVDGSGSYDDIMKNLPTYFDENPNLAMKSTFSSDGLPNLKDSIISLWDLGFTEVESNLVYEDAWKEGDSEIFESQLIQLADYMFESGRYLTHKVAYFVPHRGLPVSGFDLNMNRCGAGYKSLAFDTEGYIYPCIRFLDMCSDTKKEKKVGHIDTGIDYLQLRSLAAATWYVQSPEKCNTCDVGVDCGWCVALNYDESNSKSIYKRTTYICEMHKANARANKYYWEKYEKITGKTSPRTLEKMQRKQINEYKYLYFITSDDAPSHCNYENELSTSNEMPIEIYEKGLEFCIENSLIPIFLGKHKLSLDSSKKVYFEICDTKTEFDNKKTSVTSIKTENIDDDISTAIINYIINKNDISKLYENIIKLFNAKLQ